MDVNVNIANTSNVNKSVVSTESNSQNVSKQANAIKNTKVKVNKQQKTVTKASQDNNVGLEAKTKQEMNQQDTIEHLDRLQEQINERLASSNRALKYSVHDKVNRIIVKLVDTNTDEIIKEFPEEKSLDNYAEMLEFSGLLLNVKK